MLRLQVLRVTRTSLRCSQRNDHPLLAIILSTLLLFTFSHLAAPAVSKAQTTSGSSGNDIYPLPEERPVLVVGIMEVVRSEEHTSELQSRGHLVCRLLLEKKKKDQKF